MAEKLRIAKEKKMGVRFLNSVHTSLVQIL